MEKTHQTAEISGSTRSASLQEHDGFDLVEVITPLSRAERRAHISQYVAGVGIDQAEAVILYGRPFQGGATLNSLATRLA